MGTKIGFIKDFEVVGTGLIIPNCFWGLADTIRTFDPSAITDLTGTKYLKQILLAYKNLDSFISTDPLINKPLNVDGGRIMVLVPYTINELNEAGMQDKLVQRIQENNEYFSTAQIVEI